MPSPLLAFCTLAVLNFLCTLHQATGRNIHLERILQSPPDECRENGDVETLCQICAKRTKSNIVYPMCCYGEEGTKEWCDRYIKFGKQRTDYA